MSGVHRDGKPLWLFLRDEIACRLFGHAVEDVPAGGVRCARCERTAERAAYLP